MPKEKVQETLVEGKPLRKGERRTRRYAPPPPTVKNCVREMTDQEAMLPHLAELEAVDGAEIDAVEGL